MKIKSVRVGEIWILKKNNHRVKITSVRDTSYTYPIWYLDLETGLPDGCKVKDLKRMRIIKRFFDGMWCGNENDMLKFASKYLKRNGVFWGRWYNGEAVVIKDENGIRIASKEDLSRIQG